MTLYGPCICNTTAANISEPCQSQAAHGFTSSSKWAPRVGAFINLESTGPGGPDVVFQHAGDWTIQEYAAAAKHPRGSVVGQVTAVSLDSDPGL